jgi:HlyD family secretion protein
MKPEVTKRSSPLRQKPAEQGLARTAQLMLVRLASTLINSRVARQCQIFMRKRLRQVSQRVFQALSQASSTVANTYLQQTKIEFTTDSKDDLAYELGKAVQELPPKYIRLLGASIGALTIGAIAWAAISRTDEVAIAEGLIVPDTAVQPVQSLNNGIIQSVDVREGQHVNQGDTLMTLKSDDVQAEVADLDRQIAAVRGQIQRITELAQRVRDEKIKSLKIELRGLERQLNADLDKANRLSRISRQGAITRQEYLDAKNEASRTQSSVNQKRQEIQQLMQEDLQTMSGSISDRTRLDKELLQLAAQRQQALKRNERLTLKSPLSGTVYSLKVAPAQAILQAGQEILTILPDHSNLVLLVNVSNQDIGFVRQGMRVKTKLATFPFQEFGTLEGVVEQISPNGIVDQKAGLIFPARVRLSRNSMRVRGKEVTLVPGMAATGEIVTRQRTILSFLLEPITKRLDEGFSVR